MGLVEEMMRNAFESSGYSPGNNPDSTFKQGPTELRAEVTRLYRAAQMPTLEQVLDAVAEARTLYADKIRAARAEGPDDDAEPKRASR